MQPVKALRLGIFLTLVCASRGDSLGEEANGKCITYLRLGLENRESREKKV